MASAPSPPALPSWRPSPRSRTRTQERGRRSCRRPCTACPGTGAPPCLGRPPGDRAAAARWSRAPRDMARPLLPS
eukprot:2280015-Pyramimonas_sp.AAC.1